MSIACICLFLPRRPCIRHSLNDVEDGNSCLWNVQPGFLQNDGILLMDVLLMWFCKISII